MHSRSNTELMKGWKNISSGEVTILDKERPNPIRLLKQYRALNNLRQAQRMQKEGSWIDEIHDTATHAGTKTSDEPQNAVGKWEAIVKMAYLASMESCAPDGFGDHEAADCIASLFGDPGVSDKVIAHCLLASDLLHLSWRDLMKKIQLMAYLIPLLHNTSRMQFLHATHLTELELSTNPADVIHEQRSKPFYQMNEGFDPRLCYMRKLYQKGSCTGCRRFCSDAIGTYTGFLTSLGLERSQL